MAKPDYKKLWEQQKKQNIQVVSENVKLNTLLNNANFKVAKFESVVQYESKNAESWEQLYNKQQGQATGIMSCFKELLNKKNNKNQQL